MPNVTASFVQASEKYANNVTTLVGEIDKKLVSLYKSVDNEVNKIKPTENMENLDKQIKKALEKLEKGMDSIVHDLNVPIKFQEFYNQYYKDIGATWNRFSGSEITPGELGKILENIAAVQQISLYFSSLFVAEKPK